MRTRLLLWTMGLLIICVIARRAEATNLFYTVSGTFADGGVLSGTFAIYDAQGGLPYANLSIADPAAPVRFFTGSSSTIFFTGYPNASPSGFYPDGLRFTGLQFQPQLTLQVPFASPLVNYPGGPLCSDTSDPLNCEFPPSGTKVISSLYFPPSSIYARDGYTVDLTSGSISLNSDTSPSTVPEPSSIVFVASSLFGLGLMGGRRCLRIVRG